MREWLRLILPAAYIGALMVVLVLRSLIHYRRTGKSPIVLPRDESVHGFVGIMFRFLLFLPIVPIVLYSYFHDLYDYCLPIVYLESVNLQIFGASLMVVSFILTAAAQLNMGDSFRIGIDEEQSTSLVTGGIYRYTRNPIYLGLMGMLIGLFFTIPSSLTALSLTLSWAMIQVQIRLEEEYLDKLHGAKFQEFRKRVRRWI